MRKFVNKHEEKIRFLVAGVWNTIFGYFVFAALYFAFSKTIHYTILLVFSYIISITNAYMSYKFFVFRTKGYYMGEYVRFYAVYGITILINMALLPAAVELLKVHPIAAQGIFLLLTTIISYFGHKRFSFAIR